MGGIACFHKQPESKRVLCPGNIRRAAWFTALSISLGLLSSGLSIVEGIGSRSRWANVHDEIRLTLINDRRHVRAVDGWAPCVRDCAVRAYRIRSRKFDTPYVRARHSYEEFSGETTISIEDEATDRNEPCSGSVETVTAVQRCV